MKPRMVLSLLLMVVLSSGAFAQAAQIRTLSCLSADGLIGVESEPFDGSIRVISAENSSSWRSDDYIAIGAIRILEATKNIKDRMFKVEATFNWQNTKYNLATVRSKGPIVTQWRDGEVIATFSAFLSGVTPGAQSMNDQMKPTEVLCDYRETF